MQIMCNTAPQNRGIFTTSPILGEALVVRAASPNVDVEREYWLELERLLNMIDDLAREHPRNLAVWSEDFERLTYNGHLEGAKAGRILAGGGSATADRAIAATAVLDDRKYLARFMADILSGRYGDGETWNADSVAYRMSMYLMKSRASASVGFVAASPVQALFYWTLTAVESCVDCPRLEARSPFSAFDLPYHPAQGYTQCRTNCQCVLIRSDGVSGVFPPPPAMV